MGVFYCLISKIVKIIFRNCNAMFSIRNKVFLEKNEKENIALR